MSAHTISSDQTLKDIQANIAQGYFGKAEAGAKTLLAQEEDKDTRTMALYLLAVGYRLQKQYENALSALNELLAINANYARAFQELGYNYRALNKDKQANPNHINKVPVPAGRFKPKAIVVREVTANCADKLHKQHEGSKRYVEAVKSGEKEKG